MPDIATGAPYVAALQIADGNGSPVTSGVAGTLSLYGPASATALYSVALTDPGSHLGEGEWGVTIPGSYLTAAGRYRWVIPTLTFGATTLYDADGVFTVGEVPPEHKTLREIIVACAVALGGRAGRTDALGTVGTLKDLFWQQPGLSTNEFLGSELLILEPGAVADANPVRVTAFSGTLGQFTFSPQVAGAVAAGIDYLLLNRRGAGVSYQKLREAIDAAIAALALRADITDQTTLTTEWDVRDYTLPASWLGVRRVQVRESNASAAPTWAEIAPHYWAWWADRRILHLDHLFAPGYTLRLEGEVAVPEPRRLNDLVQIDYTAIRDYVVGSFALQPAQRAGLLIGRADAGRWKGL